MMLFSYIYLLFLAPTCFGHARDHLQGVPQYKYQEYKRNRGYAAAQLVEALRYKPEGRGFDTRWSH